MTKHGFRFTAVASLVMALAACNSTGSASSIAATSGPSTAASAPADGTGVCADAAAVKTSLTDLKALDLKTVGKAGLAAGIGKVDDAVTTLGNSAKAVAGPQVDALKSAIATLKSALDSLTSDASVAQKATDIRAAVSGVETAATALKAALTQCA
jgi:hypothetical protein